MSIKFTIVEEMALQELFTCVNLARDEQRTSTAKGEHDENE